MLVGYRKGEVHGGHAIYAQCATISVRTFAALLTMLATPGPRASWMVWVWRSASGWPACNVERDDPRPHEIDRHRRHGDGGLSFARLVNKSLMHLAMPSAISVAVGMSSSLSLALPPRVRAISCDHCVMSSTTRSTHGRSAHLHISSRNRAIFASTGLS